MRDRELLGHKFTARLQLDTSARAHSLKVLLVSNSAETNLVDEAACYFVLYGGEKSFEKKG